MLKGWVWDVTGSFSTALPGVVVGSKIITLQITLSWQPFSVSLHSTKCSIIIKCQYLKRYFDQSVCRLCCAAIQCLKVTSRKCLCHYEPQNWYLTRNGACRLIQWLVQGVCIHREGLTDNKDSGTLKLYLLSKRVGFMLSQQHVGLFYLTEWPVSCPCHFHKHIGKSLRKHLLGAAISQISLACFSIVDE